ncbi:MAG: amino acid permease [Sphingomonadales bacterium]|nr:amino acid permease [Sphingomonadales bacterium]
MSSAPARSIGAVAAMMIVAGNMIGSGIYLLPSSLADVGAISLTGWALALAGSLLVGATLVQLGRTSEADMVGQVRETLGPMAGFVAAFVYWVQALIGNVAIALAVTGYLGFFWPELAQGGGVAGVTAVIVVSAAILNLTGAAMIARYEASALALGLLPVLLVALGGWLFFDSARFAANWSLTAQPLPMIANQSLQIVFWAFLGLESASAIAGLLRNPERDLGRATLGGILLAGVIYCLACTAMFGLMEAKAIKASAAPFADAATLMVGGSLALAVAAAAAFKASGTLAGWVLVTAQMSHSLTGAEEAPLRWPRLAVHAVLMVAIILATASPTLNQQFTTIINASVGCSMLVYALCAVAALRRGGNRLVPLAALGFCMMFLALGDPLYIWIALGLAGLAIAVRLVMTRIAIPPS